MDFAIDLETLGRQAGCVILSVGAVAFERDGHDLTKSFYKEAALDQQLKQGHKVEADTLRWWAAQENLDVLIGSDGHRMDLWEILNELSGFVSVPMTEDSCVWSTGTDFDIAMLRWMYDHYDLAWPFKYWASRDLRTLCDITRFDRENFVVDGIRPHHALDDARYAAMVVQAALRGKK